MKSKCSKAILLSGLNRQILAIFLGEDYFVQIMGGKICENLFGKLYILNFFLQTIAKYQL